MILFRLEEVDDRRGAADEADSAQTAEYETFAGESVEPRQGVTKPSEPHAAARGGLRPPRDRGAAGAEPG